MCAHRPHLSTLQRICIFFPSNNLRQLLKKNSLSGTKVNDFGSTELTLIQNQTLILCSSYFFCVSISIEKESSTVNTKKQMFVPKFRRTSTTFIIAFDSNLENVNIPDFASQIILIHCKWMELFSNDHGKNHYHDDHSECTRLSIFPRG